MATEKIVSPDNLILNIHDAILEIEKDKEHNEAEGKIKDVLVKIEGLKGNGYPIGKCVELLQATLDSGKAERLRDLFEKTIWFLKQKGDIQEIADSFENPESDKDKKTAEIPESEQSQKTTPEGRNSSIEKDIHITNTAPEANSRQEKKEPKNNLHKAVLEIMKVVGYDGLTDLDKEINSSDKEIELNLENWIFYRFVAHIGNIYELLCKKYAKHDLRDAGEWKKIKKILFDELNINVIGEVGTLFNDNGCRKLRGEEETITELFHPGFQFNASAPPELKGKIIEKAHVNT